MQYEFLKQFPRRMKNVGLYALLLSNSSQKTIWKKYGFESEDEQLNVVFSVLLYIMEQSLKEENCTIDDIGVFIDNINMRHFRRPMSFGDSRELGDFIVNTVLSNEGRIMYFNGYNFEENSYDQIHINYVMNRVVDDIFGARRISYKLTDDGYNLLLGTLEIENNMKLTIQEMIFRMHLEKQSYDRALDDIKNVFNLMRIQVQKIQEAMMHIRRNALDYNVDDYSRILRENMDTLSETEEKFRGYRETVRSRVKEMEDSKIDLNRMKSEDEEKLRNLREIEIYLNRAIDEHQRILNGHLDIQSLYTDELEKIAEMSLVQRFSLRTELYDRVLDDPNVLERLNIFLMPLFNRDPDKVFNIAKAFVPQKLKISEKESDTIEEIDFDEEQWKAEEERRRKEKLKKYTESLSLIMESAAKHGNSMRLSEIKNMLEDDDSKLNRLIPEISVFKELMIELIRVREIDISALRQEKSSYIQEESDRFSLNEMILGLADSTENWNNLKKIGITKLNGREPVEFKNVVDECGFKKVIRCTDVSIKLYF